MKQKKNTDSPKGCIFCSNSSIILREELISEINCKPYCLYECVGCKIQFFYPNIYEDIYTDETAANTTLNEYISQMHKGRTKLYPSTCQLIKFIKKLRIRVADKRILDIGAGDAINYIGLNKHFAVKPENYYAIELDKNSINVCKKVGIKNIYEFFFGLNNLPALPNEFDIVILTHVLEHQTEPFDFILAVNKVLRKDGYVFITVPNRDMFKLSYKAFPGDNPPHHFLRFNKDFFRRNFQEYEKLVVQDYPYPFQISDYKRASKTISYAIFASKKSWFIIYPFVSVLYLFWKLILKIKGNGIIVILKKKKGAI